MSRVHNNDRNDLGMENINLWSLQFEFMRFLAPFPSAQPLLSLFASSSRRKKNQKGHDEARPSLKYKWGAIEANPCKSWNWLHIRLLCRTNVDMFSKEMKLLISWGFKSPRLPFASECSSPIIQSKEKTKRMEKAKRKILKWRPWNPHKGSLIAEASLS